MNLEKQFKILSSAKKVAIFGAGNNGKSAKIFCAKQGIRVEFFLDNDEKKEGTLFEGLQVKTLTEKVAKVDDLVIMVASIYYDEIEKQLWEMGVSEKRIVNYCKIKQNLQDRGSKKEQIIYYPCFDDSDELTSHYYRACWYLPKMNNSLEKVLLYQKGCSLCEKPEYMGSSNVDSSHIIIVENNDSFRRELEESKVILVWKQIPEEEKYALEMQGCKVLNVITEDDDAKEYGRYCSLIWQNFKTREEREQILVKSENLFRELAKKIKGKGKLNGCVFGTGPSLEASYEYDFTGCFSVVCNSIVQDRKLLEYINPYFITAGDVVSHLGVSLYAEVFRKDLVDYLLHSEAYYLTTAAFGYILLEQCSEIADKIILAEQLLDEQNYDLLKVFALPKLDSTLNIHMLPIVHTFCDNIYINGCDGKCPDVNNEDFWAHAPTAQYQTLVATGHKCHPTFDRNRKKSTYSGYQDSTMMSISVGEEKYGKQYRTLKRSYIDALKDRIIDENGEYQYNEEGKLMICNLK